MHEQKLATERFDLNVERQFWNDWIGEWKTVDSSSVRRAGAVVAQLRSLNLENPRILEVGCGSGWLAAELSRFGSVTGVDLADEPIAAAKAKYPHVDFIAGDFQTVDLPAVHFDLAVSVEVISVFHDPSLFVNRVASLLRSGGYLILTCPHKFVWDRTDFVRRSHGEIPLNWLNMGELKRLLRNHFSLLHTETMMPAGNLGVLRLINSYRLNGLIKKVVPEPSIVGIKERIGLGKTLLVVAQKRV